MMELKYCLDEIDTVVSDRIIPKIEKNIICIEGTMGSGKTTLIRSICKNLNFRENISSPTFSLVNTYKNDSNKIIHHFDFYRIESVEEALDFGVEEYLDSGDKCFMEWSEKISFLLSYPMNTIDIRVINDNERQIKII